MNILFNLKQKFEKFDENWRSDLEKTFSSSNKKSAEKHAFWIDHEFLRIFYHNNFQIAPGVFRSNQPSEKRILEWQREKGIQSIINFRGESNQGAFFIEKNICKQIGIKLINIKLYSSKLPEKEKIFEINEVFKTIKKPFLMHCKSGSDRAGLGSALYFLLVLNTPVEIAQKQLSFKFLHLGGWTAGILDFMLMEYRHAFKKDRINFLDWVENRYHREEMTQRYGDFRKNSHWFKIPR